MYSKTTSGVTVTVTPYFLDDQSSPQESHYVWAYQVNIKNTSPSTMKLNHRNWVIIDANGKILNVQGEGVVGEFPILQPGESFEYTSAAMIETPVGSMHGSYQMRGDDGTEFDAPIAPFRLAVPGSLN